MAGGGGGSVLQGAVDSSDPGNASTRHKAEEGDMLPLGPTLARSLMKPTDCLEGVMFVVSALVFRSVLKQALVSSGFKTLSEGFDPFGCF